VTCLLPEHDFKAAMIKTLGSAIMNMPEVNEKIENLGKEIESLRKKS
jgi:hypothetical protein